MNAQRIRDSRIEQLRVPPQSIEAEQAVLGGLMLAPDAFDRVADRLHEADFYRRDHQLIYRAICELAVQRKPYDAVTLGEWFDSQGMSEMIAGGAYLTELASTTPSAANISAYAEVVEQRAKYRRFIEIGTDIVNDGFNPQRRDPVELIGNAQAALSDLLTNVPCELEHIGPTLGKVFEDLTQRYERGGGVQGMSLGMGEELDSLLNGLHPGVYVLAARPKMGKTTLAMNVSTHVAGKSGKAVALFPLEMRQLAMAERMVASCGVSGQALRRGELSDDEWAKVGKAIKRIRDLPIYMARPQNVRVEHIVAQTKRLAAKLRSERKDELGLVVIDYLQLIQTRGDNRASELADVTRALVMLAHELGVPVLLLSQLNRALENRENKRPMPSDLRDSGAIEQDADAVIFIYRDEVYRSPSPDAGTAEIIVALQRNGPPGTVRVGYAPDLFRFSELSPDWQPVRIEREDADGGKGKKGAKPRKGFSGRDAQAGGE